MDISTLFILGIVLFLMFYFAGIEVLSDSEQIDKEERRRVEKAHRRS
jgi:hypothetical protein